jgi:subtilisin family serine protease
MGFRRSVLVIVLLVLLLLPVTSATVPEARLGGRSTFRVTTYVSPLLYSEDFWSYGAYVEDPAYLAFTERGEDLVVLNEGTQLGRVLVVLHRGTPPQVLRGRVRGVLGVFPTHVYTLVVALISREDLDKLATTPGVVALLPDVRLDSYFIKSSKLLERLGEGTPQPLQGGGGLGGGYHYTVNITRAIDVWTKYGVRGEGVTIAIIDTGVDYGSPALGLEAVARDEFGLPLVFDASSLGLVLTPVRAEDLGDGYIRVDPGQLYVFYPPYYVYKWSQGLYVAVSGCRSYSAYVSWPAEYRWYVGSIPRYGVVRFGLFFAYVTTSVGGVSTTLRFTVPVIVVDSDGDGAYDTLYADTSTALYLLNLALSPPPCRVTIPGAPTAPDYSFADEAPVTYGSEVISRDLNGDGIADFSLGTLAGYVHDTAFAILLEKLGEWKSRVTPLPHGWGYSTYGTMVSMAEIWSAEPVAAIWPGLDPYGDYAVLQYGYTSHGTFCATTAAGRDYYAQTGYGVRSMSGQAPVAKVAASPALYLGTVVTSLYFFSGFDLATPYGDGSRYLWPALATNPWIAFEGLTWSWTYTGLHQVDITSNSYGISGWALWGWASGMDPESAVFDYTTLVSGTAHFVAVGNGGPGWGTIASPAASTFSIGVGAATEFTYRPIYGYYWPGSSRAVVSWSNRGPTELGVVKPDVVAVGAFAWAVGRTWEALDARRFDGRYTHALFSGTSQATPMAAGVGALVVSAYRRVYGSRPPPYLLKTLLMNSAYDTGFDELSQGAGFVDAYRAVTAVLDPSTPRVYSTGILADVLSEMASTYTSVGYGALPRVAWYEPKIYIPAVLPGTSETRTITIEGEGRFRLRAVRLTQLDSGGLCDTVVRNLDPTIVTSCSGDSITLSVTASTVYGHLVLDRDTLTSADLFEIELVYPFEYFESGGRVGAFNVLIPTTVVELAYWIDVNADGVFSWYETARIYYDIRRANAVRIQIANLARHLEEVEYLAKKLMGVDVDALPKYVVIRVGVSGATFRGTLPIRARLVRYSYRPWTEVTVAPTTVVSRGRALAYVTVEGAARPGFYSGYVVVEDLTRGYRYLVPLSYFVPVDLTLTRTYRLTPATEGGLYRNTYLRGAFDYTWRYESGDWRVFKVYVPSTSSVLWLRATWPTYGKPAYASNVDLMVFGPWTYYMVDQETYEVRTYTVCGVQLAAELTRDPRGGGGYNPTRFWDSVGPGESVITAPTTSPGMYRVVVRNIQFSGMSYEEPVTVEVGYLYAVFTIPRYLYRTSISGWFLVYGPTSMYPLSISVAGEGAVRPAGSPTMYYIENLEEYGLRVTLGTAEAGPTYYRIRVGVEFLPGTYRGFYVVPIIYESPYPVTTVGWIDGGTLTTYFYTNQLPVYLRTTLRA